MPNQNGTPDFSDGLVPATPPSQPQNGAPSFSDGLVPVTAAPASTGLPSAPAAPAAPTTMWDKAKALGKFALEASTPIGAMKIGSDYAGAAQDMLAQKAQEADQAQLSQANKTGQSPSWSRVAISPSTTLRIASDVAGLVHGATSPEGVATIGATIAAPEVMAPYLVGQGLYHGARSWGDLRNPDVLQNELNSAAQVVGGAAAVPEAVERPMAIARGIKARMSSPIPEPVAVKSFTDAIPPSKAAPYRPEDVAQSRPYLIAEHAKNPIDSVEGVRDAADTSIGDIENKIHGFIQNHPTEVIQTSPLGSVWSALKDSVNRSDLAIGLKSLEDYNLGWERSDGLGGYTKDPPLTLAEADRIRARLNQENKAILKKNNYDQYTARETDPTFAAREAAAEALRDGIYNRIEQLDTQGNLGYGDVRQLRLDEGSLIKIRNAAQRDIFKNEQAVKGSGKPNTPARAGANAAIRAGGAGVGAWIGHFFGPAATTGGAVAGEMAAVPVAEAVTKTKPLTRGQLVERSFQDVGKPPAQAPRPANIDYHALTRIAIPQGFIRIQDSRGGVHDVPQSSLPSLQQKDPNLKVLGQ